MLPYGNIALLNLHQYANLGQQTKYILIPKSNLTVYFYCYFRK